MFLDAFIKELRRADKVPEKMDLRADGLAHNFKSFSPLVALVPARGEAETPRWSCSLQGGRKQDEQKRRGQDKLLKGMYQQEPTSSNRAHYPISQHLPIMLESCESINGLLRKSKVSEFHSFPKAPSNGKHTFNI